MKLFSNKFHEKWVSRSRFCSDLFRKLSQTDADFLEAPISIPEIKNVIWSCGGEKAPGPNGFSFKFFKKFKEIIKNDILEFVKYFEKWGKFSRGCNASFITLVAKINPTD